MKGLRLLIIFFIPNSISQVRIDLIYEGIATGIMCVIMPVCPVSPNWPDLWRDCDFLLLLCLTFHLLHLSELTWFMKGLRLRSGYFFFVRPFAKVRIDLIYEGIATCFSYAVFISVRLRRPNWPDLWRDCDCSFFIVNSILRPLSPNWPDLWRDCDSAMPLFFAHFSVKVRIDLIYEGIATIHSTS